MKIFTAAAIAACAAGCIGPNPNLGVVDVAQVPPEQAAAASTVQVLPSQPPRSTVIGPVEAASCKNKIWDPDPSEADALAQLQVKAAALGAKAIVGVSYSPDGTSLWTNCWSIIVAKAVAVK
jgi:hypothetical protein